MEVLNLVEKALNIRAFYHKVIAGNVANVETPNYKQKDIDFRKALESNMRSPDDVEVKERQDHDGLNTIDGNSVNMEDQVVKMTENNLYFNSLTKIMTKKFATMRYIITEGKGG